MQIRGRSIGPSYPPYVIAEVSCNHAGSENVAMALIQVARDAGAEAVKFQFYTPEGMTTRGLGSPEIVGGPWDGEKMYDLYNNAQMPWEWGPRLKQRCHDLGLAFIASAYEVDGLNWLEQHCQPDAYKVASFEATDTPFFVRVRGTGVPVICSTGMLTDEEVDAVTDADVILHCVSAYPTAAKDANLRRISELVLLADGFCGVGFSDHTIGHAVACAAVMRGAEVLEKHIQLHPSLKTADSHFSATPDEFAAYCKATREAWEACQPPIGDAEKDSRQFRRAPGGKRGSYRG